MSVTNKIKMIIAGVILAFISLVVLGYMAYTDQGPFADEPVTLSVQKTIGNKEKKVKVTLSKKELDSLCSDKVLHSYSEKHKENKTLNYEVAFRDVVSFGTEDSGIWCKVKYDLVTKNIPEKFDTSAEVYDAFKIEKVIIYDFKKVDIPVEHFDIEFDTRKKAEKIAH